MEDKTKLIVMPQLSFDVISADADIITNGKNSCVAGVSVRNFWEHNFECAKVEAEFGAGCDADVQSAFKTDANIQTNPYNVISYLKTTNNFLELRKALATLVLQDLETGRCELAVGYARTIQIDSCGGFRGGWINGDPRCYFGYGFEGFINPFIFNKQGFGFRFDYDAKLKCFVSYRNFPKSSAATVNGTENGVFSTKTPSECDIGIEFVNDDKVPVSALLVCSQINRGIYTSEADIRNNVVHGGDDQGTYTLKAENAIVDHLESKDKLTSITATCVTDLSPGVVANCAISCANLQEKGRVLKCSLGCVSKHSSLNDPNVPSVAYGIHLGTPAYLQTDAPNVSKDNDTPLVCEINCLFNLCGLNIPFYLDYMNKHEDNNGANADGAFIVGLRPSNFWGFACGEDHDLRCVSHNILECVEGGMMDNEDEE